MWKKNRDLLASIICLGSLVLVGCKKESVQGLVSGASIEENIDSPDYDGFYIWNTSGEQRLFQVATSAMDGNLFYILDTTKQTTPFRARIVEPNNSFIIENDTMTCFYNIVESDQNGLITFNGLSFNFNIHSPFLGWSNENVHMLSHPTRNGYTTTKGNDLIGVYCGETFVNGEPEHAPLMVISRTGENELTIDYDNPAIIGSILMETKARIDDKLNFTIINQMYDYHDLGMFVAEIHETTGSLNYDSGVLEAEFISTYNGETDTVNVIMTKE